MENSDSDDWEGEEEADERVVDDDLDGFARHVVEDDNPTPSFMRGVPQTGPKGVIADYKEYQRQLAQQRKSQNEGLWRDAAKLSLTGRDKDKSSSESDTDFDDERVMQRYRAQRMQEMVRALDQGRPQHGQLVAVTPDDYVDFIDDAPRDIWVVLLLVRQGERACATMTRAIQQIAQQHAYVKFGEAQAHLLSHKFNSEAGLPALLAYKNGELVHNMVGITDELGIDFTRNDVERLLASQAILTHVSGDDATDEET